MKIALVGCGRATESLHLPALGALPELHVAAVADLDAARVEAVGERFGIARRVTDFRELLDDPQLELFGVCVPPEAHCGVASELIGAGRNVLVEKPLALTLEDCERLQRAAGDAGVRATVGFNLRRHRLVMARASEWPRERSDRSRCSPRPSRATPGWAAPAMTPCSSGGSTTSISGATCSGARSSRSLRSPPAVATPPW